MILTKILFQKLWQLKVGWDVSELANLRVTISTEEMYVSLVASKTRVAPIKLLKIPQMELCEACLLAELFYHIHCTRNFWYSIQLPICFD